MPQQQMFAELTVDNLGQLIKTFNHAPTDVKRAFKHELKTVALPIHDDTERLTSARIRNMRLSPQWAKTRIGITQKSVYVAPRKRGTRQRRWQRPNLKQLILERSFDPALVKNAPRIAADFGRMLDRLVSKWGKEGP